MYITGTTNNVRIVAVIIPPTSVLPNGPYGIPSPVCCVNASGSIPLIVVSAVIMIGRNPTTVRRDPEQRLVQRNAERVLIGPSVDILALVLLGRHEPRGSHDESDPRQPSAETIGAGTLAVLRIASSGT